MSKTLLVRMYIPIPTLPIVPVSAMIFHRWLPIRPEDFLAIQKDSMLLTFGFDVSCTVWARERTEEDIASWSNVTAHRILADVEISNVSDDLAQYIVTSSTLPARPESPLRPDYASLGEKVYLFVVEYINRIINFIKADKGQYWLDDYFSDPDIMQSFFTNSNATVMVVGHGEWIKWRPSDRYVIKGGWSVGDPNRYVERSDWQRIRQFLFSSGRVPFARELLARAETFAGLLHRRTAIMEAVSALEVAIVSFAKHPRAQEAFGPILAKRMNIDSLAKQQNDIGLRKTLDYFSP